MQYYGGAFISTVDLGVVKSFSRHLATLIPLGRAYDTREGSYRSR